MGWAAKRDRERRRNLDLITEGSRKPQINKERGKIFSVSGERTENDDDLKFNI